MLRDSRAVVERVQAEGLFPCRYYAARPGKPRSKLDRPHEAGDDGGRSWNALLTRHSPIDHSMIAEWRRRCALPATSLGIIA